MQWKKRTNCKISYPYDFIAFNLNHTLFNTFLIPYGYKKTNH
ncbi:hypothetical protein HMPREF0208_00957 [Citrobacter koseri]|nr:hypothetical protein HMPREF3220_00202 [Citrobacter koseri]KXA05026.1 hypothetical protein HMPREF3207_01041 [Citrobacter koseri]KXB45984.1 hypothetical protein HMPREF0208_00957 [Citrobacter koseri]